jgi:hypothetical protein
VACASRRTTSSALDVMAASSAVQQYFDTVACI